MAKDTPITRSGKGGAPDLAKPYQVHAAFLQLDREVTQLESTIEGALASLRETRAKLRAYLEEVL